MWFELLKAPNPYGATWASLTKEQYYQMNDTDKGNYHDAKKSALIKTMKQLRGHFHDRANINTESPMYNELKHLQEKRNFHGRQADRNRVGNVTYFNLEDEGDNRLINRLRTTPVGEKSQDFTEEEYNAASREEKLNYHKRKSRIDTDDKLGYFREVGRMRKDENYTAPYIPTESRHGQTTSKEEYEKMSDDEKRKFHGRMAVRLNNKFDRDLGNFHRRMYQRLKLGSKLPTFYSSEEEE